MGTDPIYLSALSDTSASRLASLSAAQTARFSMSSRTALTVVESHSRRLPDTRTSLGGRDESRHTPLRRRSIARGALQPGRIFHPSVRTTPRGRRLNVAAASSRG